MDGIIEKLAINEEKVMELYSIFGDKFPEHEKFWKDLSLEEKRHASLLREFGKMADLTGFKLDLAHIKSNDVDQAIKSVEAEIEKAGKGQTGCDASFEVAKALERGMLESGNFGVLNNGAGELVKLFKALNKDTSRHFEMLKNKCGGAG